jgi:hypothetical protein
MDADFISELDKAISTVGTDKVWERTVGGVRFRLSPISYEASGKVNEAIQAMESGTNSLMEAKRITLSHAITGVNDYDLMPFRDSGPMFPVKGRDGKQVKVSLDKYLYEKCFKWGEQLINDLFSVYSDLMETHQKENLKDVRFENAKNPVEELGELMARVVELRAQLGLPELVEQEDDGPVRVKKVRPPVDEDAQEDEEPPGPPVVATRRAKEVAEALEGEFDPFKTVTTSPAPAEARRVTRAVVPEAPPPPAPPPPPSPEELDMPHPNQPVASSPQAPHRPGFATPDVIEDKAEARPPAPPLVVDRAPAGNVNPRFARPVR